MSYVTELESRRDGLIARLVDLRSRSAHNEYLVSVVCACERALIQLSQQIVFWRSVLEVLPADRAA